VLAVTCTQQSHLNEENQDNEHALIRECRSNITVFCYYLQVLGFALSQEWMLAIKVSKLVEITFLDAMIRIAKDWLLLDRLLAF
jgi:uncharacterized membrane protein YjgN (DUF898 family)